MHTTRLFGPVAAALVIALCGGTTGGTAGAGVSARSERLTNAKATTKAEAALLAASAFGPEWVESSYPIDQTFSEIGREAGCTKAHAAVLAGGAKRGLGAASRVVAKGVDTVNMDVAVYGDVKAAKAYMKLVRTPEFEACIVKADQLLTEKLFLPASVEVTKTQERQTGLDIGDDVVGYDCTFDVQGAVTASFEYNCYELRAGRAIASVGFPTAVVAKVEQQRLLGLIAARMKKA